MIAAVSIFCLLVLSGCLLALLLVPGATAASVPKVEIQDLLEGDSVTETLSVTIQDNTAPALPITLPAGAAGIRLEGRPVADSPSLSVPLNCSQCHFTVSYTIGGVVRQEGNLLVFSRTLNLPVRPELLLYEVRLPPGNMVENDPVQPGIVPQYSAIRTDGQRISVVWELFNVTFPQQYLVRYHAQETLSISEELLEWPVWVLMGFALAVGLVAGFGARHHLRERFGDDTLPYIPASLLSPDERAVIRVLEHGQLSQKELGKRLSWSKSKVSGVMTNLERKGIVAREKHGRNFKAELIKAVGK